jgi:hypothetical protein
MTGTPADRNRAASRMPRRVSPCMLGRRHGYTFLGASAIGFGGVAAQIGSDVPSIMVGLLAAHGKELETWLASHGVKSTAAKENTKMEFKKVLPSDSAIIMYAQIAVNQGRSPGLEKNEFYDAIMKRAEALRADGESPQQAFSKVITDETGRLLDQATKIAPGAELKPAPHPAPPSPEAAAKLLGPAHARLHSQAVDHQRANPRLSYEAAYSRMYTHPENASLRAEINREHLAASMAAVHG